MPPTRTFCPRCKQPITAEINQLFDVNLDPEAKQRLLSGSFNIARCPNCGFEGPISSPIVYHDPNKELLLTYFPPDLGLPVNEQERMIGPLIRQAVDRLPNEKRKGYLLRPQSMLTMQTMIERILEADGITKDMIQAQQQRLSLLQRLMAAAPDTRLEMVNQEGEFMDESFFALLSRLIEASLASNDEKSANQLMEVQNQVLPLTPVGKRLQRQAEETQAAAKSLQEASQKGLTRESLLTLIIAAPNEDRLQALVGMARGGIDYQFFQLLTERIDRAKGEEKKKLGTLREQLTQITQQIDAEVKIQVDGARKLIEALVKTDAIEQNIQRVMPAVNDLFIEVLRTEIDQARQKNDQPRLQKLEQIAKVIQTVSAPPPGVALIEELIGAKTEQEREKMLDHHRDEITPEFLDTFNNLIMQIEGQPSPSNDDKALVEQIQSAYRAALRFSMQTNLKKA
ncbi:MAG: CpXC domain-containing protein [Anaerolineaceae bacterium]|nr:CpXC domain-containing protein [Anaerolineaceae bacterium]